jgi:hypothetical protein
LAGRRENPKEEIGFLGARTFCKHDDARGGEESAREDEFLLLSAKVPNNGLVKIRDKDANNRSAAIAGFYWEKNLASISRSGNDRETCISISGKKH